MATVNPYFPKGVASEQNILQNLITESIKVQGLEVYYIPRRHRNLDLVLGEDVLSKFDTAIPLEMYMDHPGWQGQTDLIQKFGLLVQEELKFVVSKPRWLEVVPPAAPWMFNGGQRPQEGDLIWVPITKNLFEITYVDVESVYYQLSKTYQYTLTCRLFVYSSEEITTGIETADNVQQEYSQDKLVDQIMLDGADGFINIGTDSSLLQDTADDEPLQFRKNQTIDAEATNNFTVNDPFGELK